MVVFGLREVDWVLARFELTIICGSTWCLTGSSFYLGQIRAVTTNVSHTEDAAQVNKSVVRPNYTMSIKEFVKN